jgi:hypothetical protein
LRVHWLHKIIAAHLVDDAPDNLGQRNATALGFVL